MSNAPIIGIIGFGFSGLMVTANMLREAVQPLTLYIVDPTMNARGAAYSTDQPLHLLNVQAARMGAWADAPEDFFHWLTSDAGKYASAKHKLVPVTDPTAYVPRLLYGEYLASIWQHTQELAAQKKCVIQCVPSEAVALRTHPHGLDILTLRGDAIAVQQAVLAVGNEEKRVYPHLPASLIVQRPWAPHALESIAKTAQSLAILGTGLTTIDAVLSLRALGYKGRIAALSRHARIPLPHAQSMPQHIDREALLSHSATLSQLLHYVRAQIAASPVHWRNIIDGLRPHTHVLWRKLTTPQKQQSLRKLGGIWGVHRHRMAPEIAEKIAAEIAAGSLQIIAAQYLQIEAASGETQAKLSWQHGDGLIVDAVINCTGVELNIARSRSSLLTHLLSHGFITAHPTECGISVDAHYRAVGEAHGKLYALGALLTGQLLESIAVPELREQARHIAKALLTPQA